MPRHSLDYATDCFICKLLGLKEPDAELEPYLSSIGFDDTDIDMRRQKAHKIIQKYLNQFKPTSAKPITKFMLLNIQISADIADAISEPLNRHCVAYGITTIKRINKFLELCSEYSNKFTSPKPLYLPVAKQESYTFVGTDINKQIEETCKLWADLRCNYFADKDADTQLRKRLSMY